MAFTRVNGVTLYYEVHGKGDPLLLIMGLGANATGWSSQVPSFSREYQVIAFDNRGAGRSDKPNEPYSMDQMADDAHGLLDELGVGPAHVFGMSLGGMIAQELMLRHPRHVRSLILGGTMAGGPTALFAGPEVVQHFISLAGMPLAQAVEAGLALLYSADYIAKNKGELVRRSLLNAYLMAPMYAIQRQFMAVVGFNTFGRLSEIKVPTLVLTGTADRVMPAQNSRVLAEGIPGAHLVEFEGAGHGFLVECAEQVNSTALDFLRQERGPRAPQLLTN
jgi:pimeloyl-ACP methyl ester carboxylesterase